MPADPQDNARKFGEKVRKARDDRSQEYVALRLNKTKSWLSKVEHGQLAMDRPTLSAFGKLVGWSELEMSEALALLEIENPVERLDKSEALTRIESKIEELQSLTAGGQIGQVLIRTFGQMEPVPTLTFLRFIEDVLDDALSGAKGLKSGNNLDPT